MCGLVVCFGLAACFVFWSRHGARPAGTVEAVNKPVFKMAMGAISMDPGSTASVDDNAPENTSCNRHEIDIPEPMREALKKWDPDFVVWRSTEYSPYLCMNISTSPALALNAGLGDFNGDGLQDVVVAGHNNKSELLVVVLSQKNAGYKVAPLCSSSIHDDSLQGAYCCRILGLSSTIDDLQQFPRAALYEILPKGTRIDVELGGSDSYVSNLKSEAFIAGLSQDFSGSKHDYEKPFKAAQLFWWNFRDETNKEWEWLNTSGDFIAGDINTINYRRNWEFGSSYPF